MKRFFIVLFIGSIILSCDEDETPTKPEMDDKEFTISENSAEGTLVGTVKVKYARGDQKFKYTIGAGDPEDAFMIDNLSGEIKVNNATLIDFEKDSLFELGVVASDTVNSIELFASVKVYITNLVELPTNGLVAHYTFEGGNALDIVGNNNGSVVGAVVAKDRFQVSSQAFTFDGEGDYINVSNPDFRDNTEGTFAAWVKFDKLTEIQYVASVGTESSSESYMSFIRFDPSTQTLGIYQREPGLGNWVTGSTPIQQSTYYFVVMKSDGAAWSIYINGEKEQLVVVNGKNSGKWIGQLSGIDNFVIGSSRIKPPYDIPNLLGSIDEVLLYNRALADCEIEQLYKETM
jgi:hypothetical protein